jgi:hypothetical protein
MRTSRKQGSWIRQFADENRIAVKERAATCPTDVRFWHKADLSRPLMPRFRAHLEISDARLPTINASTLARHPQVQARLKEIKENELAALAAKTQITAETLIQRHDKIYQRALESGQLPSAVSANKEISILTGHRVERREVGPPDSFDHLTDDELERALVERFKALGLTLDEKAAADQPAPDDGSDTQH